MRYIPAFLLASVALLLAGCIILALPLPPLGAQTDREDIETLELGHSTREQVHEMLGEPGVTVTDRYEIFEVSEETLNVAYMWFFGMGYSGTGDFGVVPISERYYRVLAEYDPEDVLHACALFLVPPSAPKTMPPSSATSTSMTSESGKANATPLASPVFGSIPANWSRDVPPIEVKLPPT